MTRLARGLAAGGYAALRFDFTGREEQIRGQGTAMVDIGGRPFPVASALSTTSPPTTSAPPSARSDGR